MSDKTLWRLDTVMARTGLPRSTIYHKMSQKEFPQTINLGPRSVAWISYEVEEWITNQIDGSRG